MCPSSVRLSFPSHAHAHVRAYPQIWLRFPFRFGVFVLRFFILFYFIKLQLFFIAACPIRWQFKLNSSSSHSSPGTSCGTAVALMERLGWSTMPSRGQLRWQIETNGVGKRFGWVKEKKKKNWNWLHGMYARWLPPWSRRVACRNDKLQNAFKLP